MVQEVAPFPPCSVVCLQGGTEGLDKLKEIFARGMTPEEPRFVAEIARTVDWSKDFPTTGDADMGHEERVKRVVR